MLTRPFADYVHVRQAGDFYYLAGQGCRDAVTNEYAGLKTDDQGYVLSHDIREQTLGCLRNVEAALKSVSLEISNLVDVTVFMKCKDDFARMNEVWNEFFKNKATPTRTTIFISDLPGYNQIELKAIAFKPE